MTRSRTDTAALRVDSGQPDRGLARAVADLDDEGLVEIDVSAMPDQLMNLAVVAARRAADTRFVGAANLRHKECDRLAVTARELGRLGGEVEVEDDGLLVRGGRSIRGGRVNPEDDHRMAMAGTVLGLAGAKIEIEHAESIGKSYPLFYDDIEDLGGQLK